MKRIYITLMTVLTLFLSLAINAEKRVLYIDGNKIELDSDVPYRITHDVNAGQITLYRNNDVVNSFDENQPMDIHPHPITFRVLECNRTWTPGDSIQATPAGNVSIAIYELDSTAVYQFVQTVMTDNNGLAHFVPNQENLGKELHYAYAITGGNDRNTYNGYLIGGLFTSQADLDNYFPTYATDIQSQYKVGGLKFIDFNGDGLINADDKSNMMPIWSDDTQIDIYIAPETFGMSVENISWLLQSVYYVSYADFVGIDSEMSTLEARQQVNPTNLHLKEFWEKAYRTIKIAHHLIELTAPTKSEEYTFALKCRAQTYALLPVVFGNVPLVTEYLPGVLPSQSPEQEVYDFVTNELRQVVEYLPKSDVYSDAYAETLFLIGRVLLQQAKYSQASEAFATLFDSNLLTWQTGGNNDSYIQSLLLYADATNESGNVNMAAGLVNQLCALLEQAPALSNGSSQEQVRTAIRERFQQNNYGLKYINISRWHLNDSWGYKVYLPIPMSVLDSNPNIVQNPGW